MQPRNASEVRRTMTDRKPTADLTNVALLHGDLNSQQAHVYARWPGVLDQNEWQLRGTITGPTNRLTRTLPAVVPLRDMGPGADLLARAIVPDPCFWAPGYPYLYDVRIELVTGNHVLANEHREFGMRMLGVVDDRIYLESRPWKLLGAKDTSADERDFGAWRDAALTRRTWAPNQQACDQASHEGVMLIADITCEVCADARKLARELTRLSRHASVAIATLPATTVLTEQVRLTVPNLLVAQRSAGREPITSAPWADLVVYEVEDEGFDTLAEQLAECRLPVVVQDRATAAMSLKQLFDHCQQLATKLDSIQCVAGCMV